jgi:fucose permease
MMITTRFAVVWSILVAALAALILGVDHVYDVLRCVTLGTGFVAWFAVIRASNFRANLPENQFVRTQILIKEGVLAVLIALVMGVVVEHIHRAEWTLVSPIGLVCYIALIVVHIEYRERIHDTGRTGQGA